jgi:hypothetical protein
MALRYRFGGTWKKPHDAGILPGLLAGPIGGPILANPK